MEPSPTIDQLRAGPPTVSLVTAAAALGIGRSKAYDLARRGEFPVTVRRIGASYRVPVAALLDYLDIGPVPGQRPDGDAGRPAAARPFVPWQRTRHNRPAERIDPPAEQPW